MTTVTRENPYGTMNLCGHVINKFLHSSFQLSCKDPYAKVTVSYTQVTPQLVSI